MTADGGAVVYRISSTYTARQLVYAVRHAKARPQVLYETPDGSRMTAAKYVTWFRRCLHAKINRGFAQGLLHGRPLGRKHDTLWQLEARRTARKVNTARLVVRETEIPLEFRGRLRHRLHSADDF